MSCARKLLFSNGYRAANRTPDEIRLDVKNKYETSTSSIDTIAKQFKICRTTIFSWAKEENWIKKKTRSNRALYRNIAKEKLGRELRLYEHVHHINGDVTDNRPDNITVYPDAKSHGEAHGSLEKCAFHLFKKGLIIFNEKSQKYEIA